MDPMDKFGISFDKPVITFSNDRVLKKACFAYLSSLGISESVFNQAFRLLTANMK